MAKPTFILITFLPGQRGKAKASTPQTFRDEGKALAAADRIALRVQGVIVLEQTDDEFAEPRLVKAIGAVPEEMLDSLAA